MNALYVLLIIYYCFGSVLLITLFYFESNNNMKFMLK